MDFSTYSSPSYVVFEDLLENNLKILKKVQDSAGCKIILALKGYATFETFDLVSQYLTTCTASSLNEAQLCFNEFGEKAHLCAPAYRNEQFEELTKICSHITFNSLSQWERFKKRVPEDVSCGLRIFHGHSEADKELYDSSSVGSRFGVTPSFLGEVLPEGITGLHAHSLCENDAEALERTVQIIEEKFGHLLHQAKWINLGGGHLITKEGYDLDTLIAVIANLRENYKLDVILEPGMAVGWKCGFLKSTVLDIVENGSIQTAVLDISFTTHAADVLEMPYKPKVIGEASNGFKYRLGGISCLAGDYCGDFFFEKSLNVGDELIFEDMAHYSMVKNTTFNGVDLPNIVVVKKDGQVVSKQFGYEDYKGRLG